MYIALGGFPYFLLPVVYTVKCFGVLVYELGEYYWILLIGKKDKEGRILSNDIN